MKAIWKSSKADIFKKKKENNTKPDTTLIMDSGKKEREKIVQRFFFKVSIKMHKRLSIKIKRFIKWVKH